jgi:hypothetical protein
MNSASVGAKLVNPWCYIMKTYSGHIPYPESTAEMVVVNVAVHGARPPRPPRLVSNGIWNLVEMCWRQGFAERYDVETVWTNIRNMEDEKESAAQMGQLVGIV